MKGKFLQGSHESFTEGNIYADKSSLVLEWLLLVGIEREQFSIREVARAKNVSVGLVQRIFKTLVMNGYIQAQGSRTTKRFILKKPEVLLKGWLDHYSIMKKCKMRTYHTGFQGKEQIIRALKNSNLCEKIALALHSAAEVLGFKNTNLQTLELYLLEPDVRSDIEEILQLEPQERGYEVLLIDPYYKGMLNFQMESKKQHSETQKKKNTPKDFLLHSPPLLTFLDLYHFPLRGREQAEFMAERMITLKRIYNQLS